MGKSTFEDVGGAPVPDYQKPVPRDGFTENTEPWSRTIMLYAGLCAALVGAVVLGVYLAGLFARLTR